MSNYNSNNEEIMIGVCRKKPESVLKVMTHKLCDFILPLFILLCNFDAIGNSFLLDDNAKVTNTPMLRIKMNGLPNYLDETVIYYQSGATNGFDSNFDAYKLFGPNPAPHISQKYNSTLFAINGIEPVAQTFSINLLATTHITGNFTITATDFAFLPKGTCVYLNDLVTGTTVNLLTNPYSFNLSNTTTTSRFILSITHFEIPLLSILKQPTCQTINNNKFKITGTNNGPWNYTWKDSTGATIKTLLNSYNCDSLENLSSGTYSVEITSANNACYYNDTTFVINQLILPVVSFISQDTIIASVIQNYMTSNQSLDCQTYFWDFGDGAANSSDLEPTHSYAIPGLYKTKLIGTSSTGCKDSTEKYINVIDIATYIKVNSNQNIKLTDTGNNQYKINSGSYIINELTIDVVDLEGKTIFKQSYSLNRSEDVLLELNGFTPGIYVLNISNKETILLQTKIFIK